MKTAFSRPVPVRRTLHLPSVVLQTSVSIVLTLEQRLSNYLANFVGEPLVLTGEKAPKLPLFLRERFDLFSATLWGRRYLFALEDQSSAPGAPGEYEKLAAALRSSLGETAVLVLAHLPSYARNRMVRSGIPFIVPGSQLFLPGAIMDLRERFSRPKPVGGKRLTPAAQCLVLYHLQRESLESMALKDIARKIGYSPIMLTKVKDELEAAGLSRSSRQGRSITLNFSSQGRQLWEGALPYLSSPVKKTRWLQWNKPGHPALMAGLTALSQLTAIADDRLPTFALSNEAIQDSLERRIFHGCEGPEEASVRMESWGYDPLLLTDSSRVDSLSLYLSLRDSLDERIQQQLGILIDQISW
jgi:DNA-binding MarR family transcriptional regulator